MLKGLCKSPTFIRQFHREISSRNLGVAVDPVITTLIGAVIGAALGVLFAIPLVRKQLSVSRTLSEQQIDAAHKLADEQGTLRHPRLQGYLGHPELQDITILAVDLPEGEPFVMEMRIAVENRGHRAAKGIQVFAKLPTLCCFTKLKAVNKHIASFTGVRMQRISEDNGSTVLAFSIDTLPVGIPHHLVLPVIFPLDSLTRLSTTVKSMDDVELEVRGVIVHAYPISIWITDEDGQSVAFSRSIQVVRGSRSDARNYVDDLTLRADRKQPEQPAEKIPVAVAILAPVGGSVIGGGVPVFGFEGGWLYVGSCRDGAYWIPPLGTSKYGQPLYPEGVTDPPPKGRPPRITFADGEVAAPYLRIDLEVEDIFRMTRRFKTWDELTADMTPRVHARLVQLLEVYPYDQATHELGGVQQTLVDEMTPHYANRGVRLKTLEIGCLVRELST